MSQEDISRSPSPAASSADANDHWIRYPHDSSSSLTQATDINTLEAGLDSLKLTETRINDLRDENDAEPGELELKLLLAKNFMEQKQRKQATDTKGLRKVDRASGNLKGKRNADTQGKLEIIRRVRRYMVELEEIEKGSRAHVDSDKIAPPELGLSGITGAFVTPIEVPDEGSVAGELKQHLYTTDMENKALMSHFTNYAYNYHQLAADLDAQAQSSHDLHEANLRLTARNDHLVSQLEAQMQLLRTKDQETEQQVAQVRAELTAEYQAKIDALEAQGQRTYSIFSDPDFVASLGDSNTPTVPCTNPCCTGSAAVPVPNFTVNITLESSNTRLWSLLRHVRRSALWTSINTEGPEHLAYEFLASVEQADMEFIEQARRVAWLERVLADRVGGFEVLREWLR